MEGTTLATILSDVGSFVTAAVGWVGTFLNTIVSNPLLLIPFLMMIAGFGIGVIRRLVSVQ